jgi:endonuclease/exonuclease/phosphatase (EEP) superfamily protein YafD
MADLRILTINLFNGRARPDALAEVLHTTSPDIVAAQELGPDAAPVLLAALPHGMVAPGLDHRGRGLVARHPVEIEHVELGGRPAVAAQLRDAAWGFSTPVEVIGVHLMNPIGRPVRETNRLRRQQLALLTEHVQATRQPRAIVGDMNASPWWPAYRELSTLGTDAALAAGTARRTWAPRWWMPRLLRIDHVFVADLTPRHSRVVSVRGADHSGLVVDLDVA